MTYGLLMAPGSGHCNGSTVIGRSVKPTGASESSIRNDRALAVGCGVS